MNNTRKSNFRWKIHENQISDQKYMKIKFNSDGELALNKTTEMFSMIIVVRAVSHEKSKYYPQVFLDKCLYKLWIIQKCYIMIDLTFQKELMLIRQANQECDICHYW